MTQVKQFVSKYGDRIQLTADHPPRIAVKCSAPEANEIIELLGLGQQWRTRPDMTVWVVDRDTPGFPRFVLELMNEFEKRHQYGMYRSFNAGKRHWRNTFGYSA